MDAWLLAHVGGLSRSEQAAVLLHAAATNAAGCITALFRVTTPDVTVCSPGDDGHTALHLAAERGHAAALAAMLAAIAEREEVIEAGRIARPAVPPTLVPSGAFHASVREREVLLSLFEPHRRAPNVQLVAALDQRDRSRSFTPLHYAAHAGSLHCVRLLLAYGASPLAPDAVGAPPTAYAVPLAAGVDAVGEAHVAPLAIHHTLHLHAAMLDAVAEPIGVGGDGDGPSDAGMAEAWARHLRRERALVSGVGQAGLSSGAGSSPQLLAGTFDELPPRNAAVTVVRCGLGSGGTVLLDPRAVLRRAARRHLGDVTAAPAPLITLGAAQPLRPPSHFPSAMAPAARATALDALPLGAVAASLRTLDMSERSLDESAFRSGGDSGGNGAASSDLSARRGGGSDEAASATPTAAETPQGARSRQWAAALDAAWLIVIDAAYALAATGLPRVLRRPEVLAGQPPVPPPIRVSIIPFIAGMRGDHDSLEHHISQWGAAVTGSLICAPPVAPGPLKHVAPPADDAAFTMPALVPAAVDAAVRVLEGVAEGVAAVRQAPPSPRGGATRSIAPSAPSASAPEVDAPLPAGVAAWLGCAAAWWAAFTTAITVRARQAAAIIIAGSPVPTATGVFETVSQPSNDRLRLPLPVYTAADMARVVRRVMTVACEDAVAALAPRAAAAIHRLHIMAAQLERALCRSSDGSDVEAALGALGAAAQACSGSAGIGQAADDDDGPLQLSDVIMLHLRACCLVDGVVGRITAGLVRDVVDVGGAFTLAARSLAQAPTLRSLSPTPALAQRRNIYAAISSAWRGYMLATAQKMGDTANFGARVELCAAATSLATDAFIAASATRSPHGTAILAACLNAPALYLCGGLPLSLAVARGHDGAQLTAALLAAGASPVAVSSSLRSSPLHAAARHGSLATLRLCLLAAGRAVAGMESGCLVAPTATSSATASAAAAAFADDEALASAAATSFCALFDAQGHSPLHLVAAGGRSDVVAALYGGSSDRDAAAIAALAPSMRWSCTSEMWQYVCRNVLTRSPSVAAGGGPASAVVAAQLQQLTARYDGSQAAALALLAAPFAQQLTRAAPARSLPLSAQLRTLLLPGCDVDSLAFIAHPEAVAGFAAPPRSGETPLHVAAAAGHLPVSMALLQAGGDPTVLDAEMRTPLHDAAFGGWEALAAALIGCTLRVRPADGGRGTLTCEVHTALQPLWPLLVLARDTAGRTPVHDAGICGHHDLAVRLLAVFARHLQLAREGTTLDDATHMHASAMANEGGGDGAAGWWAPLPLRADAVTEWRASGRRAAAPPFAYIPHASAMVRAVAAAAAEPPALLASHPSSWPYYAAPPPQLVDSRAAASPAGSLQSAWCATGRPSPPPLPAIGGAIAQRPLLGRTATGPRRSRGRAPQPESTVGGVGRASSASSSRPHSPPAPPPATPDDGTAAAAPPHGGRASRSSHLELDYTLLGDDDSDGAMTPLKRPSPSGGGAAITGRSSSSGSPGPLGHALAAPILPAAAATRAPDAGPATAAMADAAVEAAPTASRAPSVHSAVEASPSSHRSTSPLWSGGGAPHEGGPEARTSARVAGGGDVAGMLQPPPLPLPLPVLSLGTTGPASAEAEAAAATHMARLLAAVGAGAVGTLPVGAGAASAGAASALPASALPVGALPVGALPAGAAAAAAPYIFAPLGIVPPLRVGGRFTRLWRGDGDAVYPASPLPEVVLPLSAFERHTATARAHPFSSVDSHMSSDRSSGGDAQAVHAADDTSVLAPPLSLQPGADVTALPTSVPSSSTSAGSAAVAVTSVPSAFTSVARSGQPLLPGDDNLRLASRASSASAALDASTAAVAGGGTAILASAPSRVYPRPFPLRRAGRVDGRARPGSLAHYPVIPWAAAPSQAYLAALQAVPGSSEAGGSDAASAATTTSARPPSVATSLQSQPLRQPAAMGTTTLRRHQQQPILFIARDSPMAWALRRAYAAAVAGDATQDEGAVLAARCGAWWAGEMVDLAYDVPMQDRTRDLGTVPSHDQHGPAKDDAAAGAGTVPLPRCIVHAVLPPGAPPFASAPGFAASLADCCDIDGWSVANDAVIADGVPVLHLLHAIGVNVGAVRADGHHVGHDVALADSARVAAYIRDLGVPLTTPDPYGDLPLHLACIHDSHTTAAVLLDAEWGLFADCERTAAAAAAAVTGAAPVLADLLPLPRTAASPPLLPATVPLPTAPPPPRHCTATEAQLRLHVRAAGSHPLRRLLRLSTHQSHHMAYPVACVARGQTAARNGDGATALHVAAAHGSVTTLCALLQLPLLPQVAMALSARDAGPTAAALQVDAAATNDRATPSHHAATAGHEAALALLRSFGSNAAAVSSESRSALLEAAAAGAAACIAAMVMPAERSTVAVAPLPSLTQERLAAAWGHAYVGAVAPPIPPIVHMLMPAPLGAGVGTRLPAAPITAYSRAGSGDVLVEVAGGGGAAARWPALRSLLAALVEWTETRALLADDTGASLGLSLSHMPSLRGLLEPPPAGTVVPHIALVASTSPPPSPSSRVTSGAGPASGAAIAAVGSTFSAHLAPPLSGAVIDVPVTSSASTIRPTVTMEAAVAAFAAPELRHTAGSLPSLASADGSELGMHASPSSSPPRAPSAVSAPSSATGGTSLVARLLARLGSGSGGNGGNGGNGGGNVAFSPAAAPAASSPPWGGIWGGRPTAAAAAVVAQPAASASPPTHPWEGVTTVSASDGVEPAFLSPKPGPETSAADGPPPFAADLMRPAGHLTSAMRPLAHAVCATLLLGLQVPPAALTSRDTGGDTPLHWAVCNNHAAAIDALLTAGADATAMNVDGGRPLHAAIINSGMSALRTLLTFPQQDPNPRFAVVREVTAQDSALHVAAADGRADAMSLLLHAGVSPNVRNERGRTPLHDACKYRAASCVSLLLDAGADLTPVDESCRTPWGYIIPRAKAPTLVPGHALLRLVAEVGASDSAAAAPRAAGGLSALAVALAGPQPSSTPGTVSAPPSTTIPVGVFSQRGAVLLAALLGGGAAIVTAGSDAAAPATRLRLTPVVRSDSGSAAHTLPPWLQVPPSLAPTDAARPDWLYLAHHTIHAISPLAWPLESALISPHPLARARAYNFALAIGDALCGLSAPRQAQSAPATGSAVGDQTISVARPADVPTGAVASGGAVSSPHSARAPPHRAGDGITAALLASDWLQSYGSPLGRLTAALTHASSIMASRFRDRDALHAAGGAAAIAAAHRASRDPAPLPPHLLAPPAHVLAAAALAPPPWQGAAGTMLPLTPMLPPAAGSASSATTALPPSSFAALWRDARFADVHIVAASGVRIAAHRAVLAARCPALDAMLRFDARRGSDDAPTPARGRTASTHMTSPIAAATAVLDLRMEEAVLIPLLEYLYCGYVTPAGMPAGVACALCEAADALDLPPLHAIAQGLAADGLTVEELPAVFEWADQRGLTDLQLACADFFSLPSTAAALMERVAAAKAASAADAVGTRAVVTEPRRRRARPHRSRGGSSRVGAGRLSIGEGGGGIGGTVPVLAAVRPVPAAVPHWAQRLRSSDSLSSLHAGGHDVSRAVARDGGPTTTAPAPGTTPPASAPPLEPVRSRPRAIGRERAGGGAGGAAMFITPAMSRSDSGAAHAEAGSAAPTRIVSRWGSGEAGDGAGSGRADTPSRSGGDATLGMRDRVPTPQPRSRSHSSSDGSGTSGKVALPPPHARLGVLPPASPYARMADRASAYVSPLAALIRTPRAVSPVHAAVERRASPSPVLTAGPSSASSASEVIARLSGFGWEAPTPASGSSSAVIVAAAAVAGGSCDGADYTAHAGAGGAGRVAGAASSRLSGGYSPDSSGGEAIAAGEASRELLVPANGEGVGDAPGLAWPWRLYADDVSSDDEDEDDASSGCDKQDGEGGNESHGVADDEGREGVRPAAAITGLGDDDDDDGDGEGSRSGADHVQQAGRLGSGSRHGGGTSSEREHGLQPFAPLMHWMLHADFTGERERQAALASGGAVARAV